MCLRGLSFQLFVCLWSLYCAITTWLLRSMHNADFETCLKVNSCVLVPPGCCEASTTPSLRRVSKSCFCAITTWLLRSMHNTDFETRLKIVFCVITTWLLPSMHNTDFETSLKIGVVLLHPSTAACGCLSLVFCCLCPPSLLHSFFAFLVQKCLRDALEKPYLT